MTATQSLFDRMVERDPEGKWEIYDGEVWEKPEMSVGHGETAFEIAHVLRTQLSRKSYVVRVNSGRVRQGSDSFFIPDVLVAERDPSVDPFGDSLEVYESPMLFVAEVWSPSTGGYDINQKLPRYQLRGDAEIWRLHPAKRVLNRWVRLADGSYEHSIVHSGVVQLEALPNASIDLDALFNIE